MTEYRRPKRTPSRVSHLERLLQSYGQATGVAPNRLRRWLTMMVMICEGSGVRLPASALRRGINVAVQQWCYTDCDANGPPTYSADT
jgi:hypothetical protein